ncbi:MAG: penicillin-binding transpeptidase domain-containing protein [Waddliaceae bacterium]
MELHDVRRHNYLNMSMALQKSSNIYFARLVERIIDRLGNDWYRRVLEETFGFGVKTHIELPSETVGMLPTPGKLYSSGALEWSAPTPYSLAIGHNLQSNSIQLLRAYAMLVNGGYFVQPTLIRKIVKKDSDDTERVLLNTTAPERRQRFPRLLDCEYGHPNHEIHHETWRHGKARRYLGLHGGGPNRNRQ